MSKFDFEGVQRATRDLLVAIGEDPEREGLKDTPKRVAGFYEEFFDYKPGKLGTAFSAEGDNQLVVVSGMRVWSLCEHHIIPFYCDIAVGYVPQGKVLGLSKFARIAKKHARGVQLQERLVEGIAEEVAAITGSDDVGVIGQGQHLCMIMRGIETPALMTSMSMRGRFQSGEYRKELRDLAGLKAGGACAL